MKMNKMQQRLMKDRPMTIISLRMPEDIIDDLKRIAPLLGFSGYQPLIRAYVGQGLRADLERFDRNLEVADLIESLRNQGVDEKVITTAIADANMTI